MNKVNLIIPGAGRSGTTTIFQHLENHKDICFSKIKEVHFFSVPELFERGHEYYHSFWKECKNEKIKAGADTYLFIDKNAPKRIYDYNPEMKFIIMLREPIARAFSGYNYAINNGYLDKNTTFEQSIKKEKTILNENTEIETLNNLCNAYQSLYYKHLKFWFNYFPKEKFLILKTKELKNIETLLEKISNFLHISEFEEGEKIMANLASVVKSKKMQQLLLNRNTPTRKILRKILPTNLKDRIINSGIVDKVHKINRTDKKAPKRELLESEKEFAKKYFAEDKQKLEDELGIYL